MTIKIIDKRTGQELILREFDVSCTPDNHLVFGWEYSGNYTEEDCDYSEIYEVTFPEMEELKGEIEDWDERYEIIWAILKRKGLAFPETEEELEHFDKHFDDTYLEENIKLKKENEVLKIEKTEREYKDHGLVPCQCGGVGKAVYGENNIQDCPVCKGDGWMEDPEPSEVLQLKQRIAELEMEVAGQQKIIEENLGMGSTVENKRK